MRRQRSFIINIFRTIARTLNDGHHAKTYGGLSKADTTWPISAFITHLIYLRGTSIEVDELSLTALGVKCVELVPKIPNAKMRYNAEDIKVALRRIAQPMEV